MPSKAKCTNASLVNSGNFASQTMLQVIYAGLQILSLPFDAPGNKTKTERIPLQDKQELLTQIAESHGLVTLLRVGIGIRNLLDGPICSAILHNSNPHSIFRRWQRLEKYIHSQHYIECGLSEQWATISHRSRNERPPSLEEDLVILGVMCALIHQVTQSEVHLSSLDEQDKLVFIYPKQQVGDIPTDTKKTWKISWSYCNSLRGSDLAPQIRQSVSAIERTKSTMLRLGLIDLSLEKVAFAQAMSTRTLQRTLLKDGQDYSTLLQSVRVNKASKLLLAGKDTIAEIGFICGFSDQAHFSRIFKQWTGMSPIAYTQLKQLLNSN